jgi:hypothetical protein
MQRAYDRIISPADMAKSILDKLQGFNSFNVLKHSFWYLAALTMQPDISPLMLLEKS